MSTILPRSDVGGWPAIVAGGGPAVLLLHGVGLRAEAWRYQLSALPARIIAPDMPGHGESPLLRDTMTLEDYVAAASDVLVALDEPAVVVGHSMGAMLALELAGRAGGRVKAVAALNAVYQRSEAAAAAVQARAAELDGVKVPDPTPTLKRWFGDEASDARAACKAWLTSVDPRGYRSAYRAFAHSMTPSEDTLRALTCPALFMTGADEPNSTPAMSRQMAQVAPQGLSQIIEGAAHMMPMTHPNAVNAALTDLIQEVLV